MEKAKKAKEPALEHVLYHISVVGGDTKA